MRNSCSLVSQARRRAASATLGLAFLVVVVLVLGIVTTQSAQAQTYKETVLYNFTGGADGAFPSARLILDAKGNLFSTTFNGGTSGLGVVFRVNKYRKETVLHSFAGGADGAQPYEGFILDATGNRYGTTYKGGASGAGTVFKVSSKGTETVLYSFTGGADGANPLAGLIFDAKGNLYGTTRAGGASGAGTVFMVNSKGQETVLYSFTGFADGADPQAPLIFDPKGNLYGTTHAGGTSGSGVVFKLDTTTGTETVLYNFTGGADGANPAAGLIFDANGRLYGTAQAGGASGAGVVFRVNKYRKETVLHSFAGGADGAQPNHGALIFDAKGNLYGTTFLGGASGVGVVFKVSSKSTETVLYTFTGGADGAQPTAGLILDAKGNLYGTTSGGGASGAGTVFKLTP